MRSQNVFEYFPVCSILGIRLLNPGKYPERVQGHANLVIIRNYVRSFHVYVSYKINIEPNDM